VKVTAASAAVRTLSHGEIEHRETSGRGLPPTAAWLLAAALVAITVIAYAPVWHCDFVSLDDPIYVTGNPRVQGGLGWSAIAWAFTTSYANFWHPLTWLSLMLDVRLWGVNAGPLHVTNLLLHIGSTLILFLVMLRMTGAAGRSAFVAALFGVHPLHVESVAWISERKDALSTFFWMLTLLAYTWYVRGSEGPKVRPSTRSGRGERVEPRRSVFAYIAMLAAFTLGLMAKPMLVTLPFVLLLLDVWPLGRLRMARREGAGEVWTGRACPPKRWGWWREGGRRPFDSRGATPPAQGKEAAGGATWLALVREKVPLFALAAAAGMIAFVVQRQGGAVPGLEAFPLANRAANALVAFWAYAIKMIWPSGLVPFYPYSPTIPVWPAVAALVALVGVSFGVIHAAPRRPYLAVGWFWYLGTLLPVVGLVQVGSHAMADRYTYVPLIGLFIMIVWLVPAPLAGARGRRVIVAAAVAALVACIVLTRAQVRTWKDSTTLWQHAVAVMPDNYFARNGLGLELSRQGRTAEAMAQFVQSSRLAPGFPNAHENVARLLADQGKTSEAIARYRQALQVAPDRFEAHNNLGNLLAGTGRIAEAIAEYKEALALRPDSSDAHYNLGNAFQDLGQWEQAAAQYRRTLELQPRSVAALNNLGLALERLGRADEAIAQYEASLRIDPKSVLAHGNLGRILAGAGRPGEAVAQYREALRDDPRDAQLHTDLGCALHDMGRLEEAVAEHEQAIRVKPDFADAHYNLANTLAALGRFQAAAAEYRETLRLEGDSAAVRNLLAAVAQKARPATR
jgi:tetratricopeptide (TPR) repeat protein